MSALATTFAVRAAEPTPRRHARAVARRAAWLSLLQTALFAVPIIVLGRAIGWPASLRLPAADALPLIAAKADAVLLGYGAYLLVSLALIPLAFALRSWLATRGVMGWWPDALAFIGAGAGLFKTLGIVRWLSVMPLLAAEFERAGDPVVRQMIALTYGAMNSYAGAVGELLGVQILSGIWLAAIGQALFSIGKVWLGLFGMLCGGLFLLTGLRLVWPELAAIQGAAAPLALIWFVLLAVMLRREARA
jgi:hypothetical protein